MASEPFVRYIVKGPGGGYRWSQFAVPFLEGKGWHVIKPTSFSWESSYGLDSTVNVTEKEMLEMNYHLQHSSWVVEYHGSPVEDSIVAPGTGRTIVDDFLVLTSLYSGVYCQYVWKEQRTPEGNWGAWVEPHLSNRQDIPEWAGAPKRASEYFGNILEHIPTIDQTQFQLAIRWFLSALRESEIGRPLLEAALNWVCLESQSNCLNLRGSKPKKVKTLLEGQGFPHTPRLHDLYRLRNDAFHDGNLSNLSEEVAQAARTAGRHLVRAQILNLIGMEHSNFEPEFVKSYNL